jgi:hypothetical protein
MFRVVALIALGSVAWATIHALAYWRKPGEPDQAGHQRREPFSIGVPAELVWPGEWLAVGKPNGEKDGALSGSLAAVEPAQAGAEPSSAVKAGASSAATAKAERPAASPGSGDLAGGAAIQQPAAPAEPLPDPQQLAAAIQAELKRLNLYTWPIDNIWGDVSRAAVGKYNRKYGTKLDAEPSFDLYRALKAAAPDPGEGGAEGVKQAAALKPAESYLPPWYKPGKGARSGAAQRPATSRAVVAAATAPPAPDLERRAQRAAEQRKRAARRYEARQSRERRRGFERDERRFAGRGSFGARLKELPFAWPFD